MKDASFIVKIIIKFRFDFDFLLTYFSRKSAKMVKENKQTNFHHKRGVHGFASFTKLKTEYMNPYHTISEKISIFSNKLIKSQKLSKI
jgi:hypothetical protein